MLAIGAAAAAAGLAVSRSVLLSYRLCGRDCMADSAHSQTPAAPSTASSSGASSSGAAGSPGVLGPPGDSGTPGDNGTLGTPGEGGGDGPAGGGLGSRAAIWALSVLTLINLFNYMDRYVPAALVESLRRSELHVSDTQAGFLQSGFILVYMLTSPLFGMLGDRGRRSHIVAVGIAVWSVATGLAGLARSFGALLFARSAVGVGEAAYVTISPAMLADSFPRSKRGRVFAIFNAATPIGAAAGFILGGLVDHHYGWRAAFFIAGFPGLLLALLMWRLPDPPRGSQDPDAMATPADGHAGPHGHKPLAATYADLLRNRPFVLMMLGYAAYTFALGALAYWTPAFLQRVRGLPGEQATIQFGIIVVATGFVGTFAGGWLGDLLLRRLPEAYLWVSGVATLAAAPVALLAFVATSRPVFMTAITAAEVLLFVSTGPINSALINVVAPMQRATAMALNILVIHLLGDVPSPPLIGRISDATSLGTAFLVLPGVMALAGVIWIYAAVHGRRSRSGGALARTGATGAAGAAILLA
jgi:predicted MFS family arabinose efflux permease